MWDIRTNVTASLERGTKVKYDFEKATLGCAPEVIHRYTSTMVGGHGARDKLRRVEGHHRKRINVWMLMPVIIFWFGCMHMFGYVDI